MTTNSKQQTTKDPHADLPADEIGRVMSAFRSRADERPAIETMSAPAFRAIVAERLRALERDLAEVRTRINGLLFVVAGAVVTQVMLRLLA